MDKRDPGLEGCFEAVVVAPDLPAHALEIVTDSLLLVATSLHLPPTLLHAQRPVFPTSILPACIPLIVLPPACNPLLLQAGKQGQAAGDLLPCAASGEHG